MSFHRLLRACGFITPVVQEDLETFGLRRDPVCLNSRAALLITAAHSHSHSHSRATSSRRGMSAGRRSGLTSSRGRVPSGFSPNLQKGFEMNRIAKSELVDGIAEGFPGMTKKMAGAIIDVFLGDIARAVAQGQQVVIKGFGTFEPRHRVARVGRNPRTGEDVQIPASTTMGFRAAKVKG